MRRPLCNRTKDVDVFVVDVVIDKKDLQHWNFADQFDDLGSFVEVALEKNDEADENFVYESVWGNDVVEKNCSVEKENDWDDVIEVCDKELLIEEKVVSEVSELKGEIDAIFVSKTFVEDDVRA